MLCVSDTVSSSFKVRYEVKGATPLESNGPKDAVEIDLTDDHVARL